MQQTNFLQKSEHPIVFYPFDVNPPSASDCLTNVYTAFANYSPVLDKEAYNFDAIGKKLYKELVKLGSNRQLASINTLLELHLESGDNIGGATNIKFWLPRVLETILLTNMEGDFRFLSDLYHSTGMPGWPETEQEALRQIFCRALINYVEHGDPTPLKGLLLEPEDEDIEDTELESFERCNDILLSIISMLIYLRVDAKAIFSYLSQNATAKIDYFFANEVNGYFLRPQATQLYIDEIWLSDAAFRNITDILAKRARADLFTIVSQEYLENCLQHYKDLYDEEITDIFETAIKKYKIKSTQQSDDKRKEAEDNLRKLLNE